MRVSNRIIFKKMQNKPITILLSVNPIFLEKIFNGEKLFEFRRLLPRNDVWKIIFYATAPIQKIVGEAIVDKIFCEEKEELWLLTKNKSGIDKNFYDRYYHDKKIAYAYKLKNIIKYEEPKTLNDLSIKAAPQSFVYLK